MYGKAAGNTRSILIVALVIIFLEQFGSNLYKPDILRMLDSSQHMLNPNISQTTRNWLLGITAGLGAIVGMYTNPVFSNCSDAWGRKKTIILIHVITIISLILPIIGIHYNSFTLVILSNFFGVSVCARIIAKASLVDISHGTKRKLYMGIATIAKDSPVIIGPLLGAYLSDSALGKWFSLQTPFYLGIVIVIINTLIVIFCFKNSNNDTNTTTVYKPTYNFFQLIFNIKNEPKFVKPLIAFGLYEFSFALLNNDIPLFWHEYLHVSIINMSKYTGFVSLLILIGWALIYPLWIKFIAKKYQMSIPLITLSLSAIGIAYLPNIFIKWLLTIPANLGAAIVYPQFLALMTEQVHETKNGWAMGIIYIVVSLVWGMSSLTMVPLHAISPHYPLLVTSIFSLISLWVIVSINER